jgi:hypothetical protein
MARNSDKLKKWVRLGAWTRLAQMDEERAEILYEGWDEGVLGEAEGGGKEVSFAV